MTWQKQRPEANGDAQKQSTSKQESVDGATLAEVNAFHRANPDHYRNVQLDLQSAVLPIVVLRDSKTGKPSSLEANYQDGTKETIQFDEKTGKIRSEQIIHVSGAVEADSFSGQTGKLLSQVVTNPVDNQGQISNNEYQYAREEYPGPGALTQYWSKKERHFDPKTSNEVSESITFQKGEAQSTMPYVDERKQVFDPVTKDMKSQELRYSSGMTESETYYPKTKEDRQPPFASQPPRLKTEFLDGQDVISLDKWDEKGELIYQDIYSKRSGETFHRRVEGGKVKTWTDTEKPTLKGDGK